MNFLISQNMERSQSELNSLNLIKGHIQIVQASITQNFGKILNSHNNLLAKFFGFSSQEFKSINHIKQLMPQYVAQVHDELINAFIIRGHSKFLEENHQVFCRNKQGFFVPITLQLTLVYGITDDLQMNAVLLKLDSNTSYITFNQIGEIVGFNVNFFNHIFGLETATQDLDQEKISLKKHIESLNVFILMPRLAKIVLKFLKSINLNKLVDQTEPIIQKQQLCRQKKLNLFLLQDLLEFNQNSLLQNMINIDYYKNTNQTKGSDNQLSFLEKQIQLVSSFINFYKENIEKWQEINCYTMFQGLGNLVVNSIKRTRKLTDNVLEEYVFELTLSDIQFGGYENQKKNSQISKKQRFEELNFLRMMSQDVTTQGYQQKSNFTTPKNQKDLYVIKKTNSLCSYDYSQDSQFDYQLEQNKQSTMNSNNKNIHDQSVKQKNDDFQKQFHKDLKIQYNQSKFSNQYHIENSIISSEQAQITDYQYQIDNNKCKILTSQRMYNNENQNSFYLMKDQQSEQQLNEDDKQNEEGIQDILMKNQETLEQKFNNHQIQLSQKEKKFNSVQKHFINQQQTLAVSSKYNQQTSKIESENNENQDDFNQIQETNSNLETFKENQIINNIIFQQLTIGSQISRFLLGKLIN
ncbi:hypothetical protein TTHERM_01100420 (macronuclear) [Tetrahymena thermophila SB210]|uniref:Uncharacterized protein n=1 Tax=Tetrahymena thermophila (strain SB210) TaxID=312017 RepID=Q22BH0_TETTS|nr:hypothetical protein TTHERM_01100420 [Tetrahymena thermophila SB210]EAR82634.2 hypothetical protein TTHERM_01100420 [Tetrahymena thermophila SB210]|eukprot:XP_001030297.2 hypothetical protein TTHERM_01100420 [Tetrahymena thermophila SB210]